MIYINDNYHNVLRLAMLVGFLLENYHNDNFCCFAGFGHV